MAKAKEATLIETASDKYRRLKNETFDKFIDESFEDLQGIQTESVTTPSGMPFKIRRIDNDFYSAVGTMPMHLANKVQSGESEEQIANSMTAAERERMMELSWKALFYGCIEPRVVVNATAENHLQMDDLLMGDMKFLVDALMKGGKEAERLQTFRKGRR